MRIILDYVNTSEDTIQLDLDFGSMDILMRFVSDGYPNWTSYSVTVVKR